MEEIEIIGTFDTEDTAREVAKALNNWIAWIMEGDLEETPEFFDDFGVDIEDYALDRDHDVDWVDAPSVRAHGNKVTIFVETENTTDMFEELLESLGAFDVSKAGDEE